jgi:anti-sigma-K factor RskA
MNGQTDEIDDIEALLPWYAAGALEARDVARVEAALERRPELRASLALVREDRDETITLDESLGAPSADVWTRVLAVAQAEPRKPSFSARVSAWMGFGGEARLNRLVWAGAAAAIVVILAQGVAITQLLPRQANPNFGVAAGPARVGAEALVQFTPDARLDQVSAFLREHKAVITDGPRAGFYRLSIGDKPLAGDDLKALLATLGQSAVVKLALPGGK